jgi:uncharacterized membrane-anchored protein
MIGSLRKYRVGAAILVALLQCGVLGWMIQSRAAILQNGMEIVLKTQPIDPRDLLRGDFVTLGYDLSSIPESEIAGDPGAFYAEGSHLYVVLTKNADGFWQRSRASAEPATDLKNEEVLLRGRSQYGFSPKGTGSVHVRYGIERYYVPEGEGREIETAQQEKRIDVVIMVDNNGKAQIRALRDNGVPLYEEPLY